MSKTPSVDGKRLIKILAGFDFEVIRVRGSHHFLRHQDGCSTVVPVHGKETIGKGLFHKIMKDCEISVEEFVERL